MKLVVNLKDFHPYTGSYTVDLTTLSNRDYHDIKRLAGYTPPEIASALERGDMDMMVAFTIIALRKSGLFPVIDEEAVWDATADKFDMDATVPELDDADPPTIMPEPRTPTTPSGKPSPNDGDNPEAANLARIGMDSSESATYVRKTLAT